MHKFMLQSISEKFTIVLHVPETPMQEKDRLSEKVTNDYENSTTNNRG